MLADSNRQSVRLIFQTAHTGRTVGVTQGGERLFEFCPNSSYRPGSDLPQLVVMCELPDRGLAIKRGLSDASEDAAMSHCAQVLKQWMHDHLGQDLSVEIVDERKLR